MNPITQTHLQLPPFTVHDNWTSFSGALVIVLLVAKAPRAAITLKAYIKYINVSVYKSYCYYKKLF